MLDYDTQLVQSLATQYSLRDPNTRGLETLVQALSGDFDPAVPVVLDMCTGSGKTFLMAAFTEYLRHQDVRNAMIVTPSLVVQSKTVQNFRPGTRRFIPGADVPPNVITPDDNSEWAGEGTFRYDDHSLDLFVFNIQQLIAPRQLEGGTSGGKEATQRRIRRDHETVGNLYRHLTDADDLVIVADEHHLYGPSAKAFRQAIRDLQPAAVVGLTASASKTDNVIYRYPLYQAIEDGHVKAPVIAFRRDGYGPLGEEQQLRDSLALLRGKQSAYDNFAGANADATSRNAVLFVVCSDVAHATETAQLLRGPDFFDSAAAVLQVDNQHDDLHTREQLDRLDDSISPVRAVVSVDKLREGWDVKTIAVMVTLRSMTSDTLTQQTMGRGLRLPFGRRTGVDTIDQLDIVAHDSFRRLLNDEDVLKTFGLEDASRRPTAAPTPVPVSTAPTHPEGAEYEPVGGSSPAGLPASTERWDIGGLNVRVLDDDVDVVEPSRPEPVVVSVTPTHEGTRFLFPASTMRLADTPFELADIPDDDIRDAAKQVTDSGDVMEREAVGATRTSGRLRLSTRTVQEAAVEAISVHESEVEAALVRDILVSQLVERSTQNVAQAWQRIVPVFMESVPIEEWTEIAAVSASSALRRLMERATTEHVRSLKPKVDVYPRELPISEVYRLPEGEGVLHRVDHRQAFAPRRHYDGWQQGLFNAASFDSYGGEYAVAELLDRSDEIIWWKRLYPADHATIDYTLTNTYRPDFVCLDADDVYWIIEAKAATGRDDETVQLKRAAAERVVRRLLGEAAFAGTRWGYLIAYEDTARDSRSWRHLRDISTPVVSRKL